MTANTDPCSLKTGKVGKNYAGTSSGPSKTCGIKIMKSRLKLKQSEFHKHHRSCKLRNPMNKAMDWHDICKQMVMLTVIKKYKTDVKFIASEYPIPGSKDIADVLVEFKNGAIHLYEVQYQYNQRYIRKIISRDKKTDTNTVIINLSEIPKHIDDALKCLENYI